MTTQAATAVSQKVEVEVEVELDSALSTIFLQAEKTMGLRFQQTDSQNPYEKTFQVKDAANEQLVGLVRLAPFTARATAASANSAEDRTISVISVSMNLQKPEDGQTASLNAQELQTLFKLSGHALSTLAARKQQQGLKIHTDFVGGPTAPNPSA